MAFREAVPADKAAVVATVGGAFGFGPGTPRWQHTEHVFAAPGRTWLVLEEDGAVVATLCVNSARLRVGRGYLLKGDVGEVAVRPERQAQGLGTALMRHTVDWLGRNHYDISRLGGLVRFYSRFGYEPFVRRYVEFYLNPGVGAGAATLVPPYLAEPAERRVFPLASLDEWQHCRRVQAACNGWRTGAAIEDDAPVTEMPSGAYLVYREGEGVLAWLQTVEHPIDRTEFESRLSIGAGAWEEGRPEALAALVAHVLREGHARGHQKVSARLPFDPKLFAALTEAYLPYKAVELHEASAGTMVQVHNLRSLIDHLLPELDHRWRAAALPLSTSLAVRAAGQEVTLSLTPEGAAIVHGLGQEQVSLASPALLGLALGLHSPSYLLDRGIAERSPRLMLLLGLLFPEQLAISGTWG